MAERTDTRVDWILLINSMLATFLVGITIRIFAISLPTVATHLHTDMAGISWALISFELSTISLSLVFGRIGDIYGRQTVFSTGLLVITAGTFLCGVSQNIWQLIFFRLLQGIGAAMLQAQTRALAMEAVPQGSVGKTQGILTTAFQSGYLLGPSLGGLIIDYIHWRGIFFFLTPIGAAGATLALMNKKRSRTLPVSEAGPRPSIDYLGAALLVTTTLALIAILDRRIIEILGLGLRPVLILAFIGFFTGFLVREGSASSPILNLSLFKIRMFSFSTICHLLVTIMQAVTIFLLPFYLQEVLYISPSFMGFLFMCAPLCAMVVSPMSGVLFDKVGPRLPATAGVALFGVASFLGTILKIDSHWLLPTLIIVLSGLANALFFPPNHSAMISSVPIEHRGVATGSVYVMFGLGNTLGYTLSRILMTLAFRFHTGLSTATPTTENPTAFVAALNTTFVVVVGIGIVNIILSIMRGTRVRSMAGTSGSE